MAKTSFGNCAGSCPGILIKSVTVFWQQTSWASQVQAVIPQDCFAYCGSGTEGSIGVGAIGDDNCPDCTISPSIPTFDSSNGYNTDAYLSAYSYHGCSPSGCGCTTDSADVTTGALSPVCGVDNDGTLIGAIASSRNSTPRTSVLTLLATVDLSSLSWGEHGVFAPPIASSPGVPFGAALFTGTPTYNLVTYSPDFIPDWIRTSVGTPAAYCDQTVGAAVSYNPALNLGCQYYTATKFAILVENSGICVATYTANFSCAYCNTPFSSNPTALLLFSNPTPPVITKFGPNTYAEFEPTQTPDYIEVGWNSSGCIGGCNVPMANYSGCCPV